MPGGFWIFLLIVVANLVITVIKKAAEKRAKAERGGGASGEAAPATEPPPRRFTGEGDHEMVLQRTGDQRLAVIEILRKELRWDLPTAMTLAGTTPSVVATGLTRSEAGFLRNRFESVHAGVSVRRRTVEGPSTARDLDLSTTSASARSGAAVPVATARSFRVEEDRAKRRAEALRRRDPAPAATSPSAAPTPRAKTPPRPPATSRPSAARSTPVAEPIAARAELPELPRLRAAKGARVAAEANHPLDGAALADRIRGVTRDRDQLRQAFLLQELLRPPLSLRSSGSGGRDS